MLCRGLLRQPCLCTPAGGQTGVAYMMILREELASLLRCGVVYTRNVEAIATNIATRGKRLDGAMLVCGLVTCFFLFLLCVGKSGKKRKFWNMTRCREPEEGPPDAG